MSLLVIGSIATLTPAARSATERAGESAEQSGQSGSLLGGARSEHSFGRTLARSVTPCADARRGLAYYRSAAERWRRKLGAGRATVTRGRGSQQATEANPLAVDAHPSCPQIHHAVRYWRAKARENRLRYERWSYQYEWRRWLPAKFYRVARCETGVDWHFDSGTYVSAFGIIRVAFPSWNGRNSPREQYEVAASLQRRYSWSAWGCGGA